MADYKQLDIGVVLRYYKRKEVQDAIVREADRKEVAVSYGGTGYGKRPDILNYPAEVIDSVKNKATSFHCSEELWSNPLDVETGMKPKLLDELRTGWDLLLDIDCPELDYSRIGAHLLVEALTYYGVKSIAVKFSGNHGFHIGVPFEAFPPSVAGKRTADLFPEGPRKIALLLQEKIRDVLAQRLLAHAPLPELAQKVGKKTTDLIKNNTLDPFEVLAIDTILIAPRHLYRMPYSLNEKSGLVSVVIPPSEILTFDIANAQPERVTTFLPFWNREAVQGEAKNLLVEAFDFHVNSSEGVAEAVEKKQRVFEPVTEAVPEQYFPPCIQRISEGITDGRKRAVFILINFLSSIGWSKEQIETYLKEWNEKNAEPLREVYLLGQLRHAKGKKPVLPPNCANKAYMVDLGVCNPDGFCKRIKNPAQYAIRKQRAVAQEQPKKRAKKAPKQ